MSAAKQDRAQLARLKAYQTKQAVAQRIVQRRKSDNLRWGIIGAVAGLVLIAAQVFYFVGGPTSAPADDNTAAPGAQAPDPALAEGKTWSGTLTLNSLPLHFELDGAKAPQAVASFLSLADQHYFDEVSCHRLTTTPGFALLQCGDPKGDGSGGPGYAFGPIENAPKDNFYPAGTIAMARHSNDGFSMGSQFFIVYEDTMIPADGAGGYTVMGRITNGLEAFITDFAAPGTADGGADGAPVRPITIKSVTIDGRVG